MLLLYFQSAGLTYEYTLMFSYEKKTLLSMLNIVKYSINANDNYTHLHCLSTEKLFITLSTLDTIELLWQRTFPISLSNMFNSSCYSKITRYKQIVIVIYIDVDLHVLIRLVRTWIRSYVERYPRLHCTTEEKIFFRDGLW